MTIDYITQPQQGAVVKLGNGKIRFTTKGVVGSSSFSYTIFDGHGGTDTASVTASIIDPASDNISFLDITDETVTIKKGIAVTVDVLANNFDADGDTLVLDRLSGGVYGIAKKINYTPNANFIGTDTIWYDSHGHSEFGSLMIHVED